MGVATGREVELTLMIDEEDADTAKSSGFTVEMTSPLILAY